MQNGVIPSQCFRFYKNCLKIMPNALLLENQGEELTLIGHLYDELGVPDQYLFRNWFVIENLLGHLLWISFIKKLINNYRKIC